MTVTWIPDTGTSEILADDSLGRGAGSKYCLDEWPEHSRSIQTVGRVRAGNISVYDRGNSSVTYNLVVRVEFATMYECMAYRHDIANRVKGKGKVVINYDGGGARTIQGAGRTSIQFAERYGVSTVVNFQFVGEYVA